MSLIIKMDPIMSEKHLKTAIPYVLNDKKTGGLSYSNVGITAEQIANAFMLTKKLHPTRGKRQVYHFKFSFSKDETITHKEAFEFVKEWAEEYLGDSYDYVVSAHSDRNHVHMHLVFNSVSREGKKFNFAKEDWERKIKPLTNRLAAKYHIGALKEKDKNLDYSRNYDIPMKLDSEERLDKLSKRSDVLIENSTQEKTRTWVDKVRKDIDTCIKEAKSYKDFKRRLQVDYHYTLREGVSRNYGLYLALTPPGKARAIRSYRLGTGYQPGEIAERITNHSGSKKGWRTIRMRTFIEYDQLSEYQKAQIRKMMEARSLYRRTNTSLQMHESSVHAIRKLMEECNGYGIVIVKGRKVMKGPAEPVKFDKAFSEQMMSRIHRINSEEETQQQNKQIEPVKIKERTYIPEEKPKKH